MQRTELTGLHKYLGRLEQDLARIQVLQDKGRRVDSSLNDVYSRIADLGNYLKRIQTEKSGESDQEFRDIALRHKKILAQYDAIANEVKPQAQGMVLASENTLPAFFNRVTSRNRGLWKFYESVITCFGIGMIVFMVTSVTCVLTFGGLPFIHFNKAMLSGINCLYFVAGLTLGLCLHEFAHGIVLANNGIKINRVGAVAGSVVGGFVEADETTFFQADPRVHLRFNAAGIGTNALVAVILGIIGLLASSDLLLFMALGSLFFGFINSLPVSPLDGGWVYEDIVKMYVENQRVKGIFLSARFVIFVLWIVLFTHSALFYYS